MSIASRIQEIETHIGDVYDTINYSYDTTGINKNIINIPKYLKKGYIDIINNGIDNLYNNFPKVSGIGSNLSLTPTYESPMKLNEIQGSTLQDGSPTPDTPVEIQSVTGLQNITISNADNTDSNTYEVNLGKNLLDINDITTTSYITNNGDGSITLNGTGTGGINFSLSKPFTLKANTSYTLSLTNTNSSYSDATFQLRNGNTNIFQINYGQSSASYTPTSDTTIDTLRIFSPNTITFNSFTFSVQLEKGSQATSYSSYFTPIELNKINTYQDSIKKSTGKNLFDKSTITTGQYIDASGNLVNDNSNFVGDYIPVDNTKSYYASQSAGGVIRVGYYDSNKTFISRQLISANYGSLTIPNNAVYVRLSCYNQSLDTLQLELGTSSSNYEPYGKVWYVEKQIGKVVLDGSETWIYTSGTRERFTTSINDIALQPFNSSAPIVAISNYFVGTTWYNLYNNTSLNNAICSHDSANQLNIRATQFNGSTSDFANWLNENKPEVIYALATPTYTEITNTELINQLESLNNAKSEDGTTNINVTSEDLSMILNVGALKGDA